MFSCPLFIWIKGKNVLYFLFVFSNLKKKTTFRTSVLEQKLVPFQEIDGYIMQASDKGYSAVISLGSKGLSYATNVVLSTAIKVNSLLLLWKRLQESKRLHKYKTAKRILATNNNN